MAVALGMCAGCWGADLGNFTGQSWHGPLSTAGICNDGSGSHGRNYLQTWTFEPAGGNSIEYAKDTGCVFRFNVSGNTAILSNGPVVCSGEMSTGAAGKLTYTRYTATTNDGHHLSVQMTIKGRSGDLICAMSGNGSGTR